MQSTSSSLFINHNHFDGASFYLRTALSDSALHCPLPVGAFVQGAANTNVCPAGSTIIATAVACQQAASALGMSYQAAGGTSSTYPKGCYKWTTLIYFNTHATGAAQAASTPICSSTATGALIDCAARTVLSWKAWQIERPP
jgi:hypothetical protein